VGGAVLIPLPVTSQNPPATQRPNHSRTRAHTRSPQILCRRLRHRQILYRCCPRREL